MDQYGNQYYQHTTSQYQEDDNDNDDEENDGSDEDEGEYSKKRKRSNNDDNNDNVNTNSTNKNVTTTTIASMTKNNHNNNNNNNNEGLTVHSYGAVTVNYVEDECWLLRIPPSVAELWEKTKENTYLGELVFTKGGITNTTSTSTTTSATAIATKTTGSTTSTNPIRKPTNSIMPPSKKLGGAGMNSTTGTSTTRTVSSNSTSTAAPAPASRPSITLHLDEESVRTQLERQAMKKKPKSTTKTVSSSQQQPSLSSSDNNNNSTNIRMIPLHYSLQAMTKKVPILHPMIRNPKSGRVILDGTITRTANVQVERSDTTYRTMIKDRLVSSMNVSKFVKPMEATDGIINKHARIKNNTTTNASSTGTGSSNIPGISTKKNSFAEAVFQFGQRKLDSLDGTNNTIGDDDSKKGLSNNKKKTLQFAPDQPLRSVLFELFQYQTYWTIKDLRAAALGGGAFASQASINQKRLEGEIREVLREEIGEYHRSGDNKNKWELRKEFQQYTTNTSNTNDTTTTTNSNNITTIKGSNNNNNNNGGSSGGTPKSKSSSSSTPGSGNSS